MDAAITRPAVPRQRWRAFYAVVWAISTLFGAMNLAGPLEGLMHGCSVHFGQGGDGLAPGRPGCASYIDVQTVVVAVLAGIVLIVAAVRYHRRDRVSTAITAAAIVTAVLISAVPLFSVWWLVGYYRLGVGPMELIMFGVAITVLGVALGAGWRTARYILERRASHPQAWPE
jgi:hypothetical protein